MIGFSPQRRNKCHSCFEHFHFQKCFSPQLCTILQHQNLQKWSKHVMFCAFSLPNVLFATGSYNFATSELTNVVQTRHVLPIFTSQCAFRRVVQFCNIRTYKSGPNTSCFVHFHFPMCFSPQVRAFFKHQNLQKWSKHVVFCAFSLPKVPFATAVCIFSTSQRTKVLQTPHVLYIFTATCAFRHSGVQFFDIVTSKSASELTCFVHFHFKMCFSPQRRAIFDFSSDHMTPHPPL